MRDANCHDHVGVGQGASVSVRVYESVVGVCIWLDSVRAFVVAVILKCSTFLMVISECSISGVIFPLTPFFCSLYWHWDPLSSLESTSVSIQVLKQADCNMCRFGKFPLVFSSVKMAVID